MRKDCVSFGVVWRGRYLVRWGEMALFPRFAPPLPWRERGTALSPAPRGLSPTGGGKNLLGLRGRLRNCSMRGAPKKWGHSPKKENVACPNVSCPNVSFQNVPRET